MKLHRNSWPKTTNAIHYKLLSELILELVDDNSWDSYRAHALSTLRKIRELLRFSRDVANKTIPKKTIFPIIQELNETLQDDPIVDIILRNKNLNIEQFGISENDSIETINANCIVLINFLFDNYKNTCEQRLIDICKAGTSKFELVKIAKLYVSHILNSGFSRKFVRNCVVSHFYTNEIKRCSKGFLTRFFNNFAIPARKKEFDLAICGPTSSVEYLTSLFSFPSYQSLREIPNFPIKGIKPDFGQGSKKQIVLIGKLPASDPYAAAERFEFFESIARSFLYMHPAGLKLKFDDNAYSIESKTKIATLVSLKEVTEPRKTLPNKRAKQEGAPALVRYLFATPNSSRKSRHDIFRSLTSLSLAAAAPEAQTSLVSIWAAFEALLPEPTRDGDKSTRITHFAPLIVQCSVYDYPSEHFSECYQNCKREFGRSFIDFVASHGTGTNAEMRFASLFAKSDDTKKELCRLVSESPLMLNRFFTLEKLISDPKNAVKLIKSHEIRVENQIHRIYRERNLIVHRSDQSKFIKQLVQNAYSYYRSVFIALERINTKFDIAEPEVALYLIGKNYIRKIQSIENMLSSGLSSGEKSNKYIEIVFGDRLLS